MKHTFTLVLLLGLFGCDSEDVKRNIERNKNAQHISGTYTPLYKIVIIDSCEYLVTQYYNVNATLTHKGNCKFCIERNKIKKP